MPFLSIADYRLDEIDIRLHRQEAICSSNPSIRWVAMEEYRWDRDTERMLQDLRVASRLPFRRPAWSAAIVGTLALGIGASVAIFSFVHALVLRPLPFPNPQELFLVDALVAGEPGNIALREFRALEQYSQLTSDLAAYYESQYNATGGGPPENLSATLGTGNLFAVLGVPMLYGDTWAPELDFTMQYTVVLSHHVWQQRYGSRRDIVGQSVVLDGATYRVAGVLPDGFDYPVRTDVFRAVSNYNADHVRRFSVLGRARAGVDLAAVQAELDGLGRRLADAYPDTNRGVSLRLRPLRDVYVGGARPYLLLLPAAVLLLLLLACANVANLLLSHALTRAGDSAVRLALGADRSHLVRQTIMESLVLAVPGAILGTLAAGYGLDALMALVRADLPAWFAVRLDEATLIFATTVTLLVSVGLGLVPAWQASRTDIESTLRQEAGRSLGGDSRRLRALLVGAQAAVATTLLVSAAVFTAGLMQLQQRQVGFDPSGVLTFRVDPPFSRYGTIGDTSEFYRRAIERLSAEPGVASVATSNMIPFSGLHIASPRARREGVSAADGTAQPFVNFQIVSPEYFDAMRIPMRRGRTFNAFDLEATTKVAVVSERTAQRLWGGADPIGQRLAVVWNQDGRAIGGGTEIWMTVVGVSGDVRFDGLSASAGLDVYTPHTQAFAGDSYFLVRTRVPPETLAARLPQAIYGVDPEQSFFDVRTLTDRVDASVWQQRVTSVVLGAFALLALTLAIVGVHAVTSYAVAVREREIGVRLALGASGGMVSRLMVREAVIPVLGGVVVGLGLSVVSTIVLARALPDGAVPSTVLALPLPLLLLVTAAIAAWLPVRKVLRRADLVNSLRA
jgi:putative ABC transport system permease protein